jgi:hypothetical protein
MPTNRRIQRLSRGTHGLSRDPNLADESHFDPLTPRTTARCLKIRTERARMEQPKHGPGQSGRRIAARIKSGQSRTPQPKVSPQEYGGSVGD